jgi:hypothetical protein
MQLANPRVDHPAPAVICVHGWVYVSSPKNQAQPVGLFDDKSVNEIGKGADPDCVSAVNSARGAVADTPEIRISKKIIIMQYAGFPIIFNTPFL